MFGLFGMRVGFVGSEDVWADGERISAWLAGRCGSPGGGEELALI